MPICQFYLRGQCKFGTACKNEHPPQRPGGFGNAGQGTSGSGTVFIPFTQDGLAKDMIPGAEKPLWPLSSYGSAKFEPTIIANLDESYEELRWKAVEALKAGNVANYQKYESEKIQEADQTYSKALSEIAQVYKHASNLSTAAQKGIINPAGVVYNTPTNTASTAFGKPAPSAFGGSSAFGSAAPASTSAFGGTSTSTPAFGSSAFGKPAFRQSAFGQPAFGQSAFGQTSKPVSAFGQASPTTLAFGQAAQSTSAFGSSSQQPTTSAFGQTSQPQSSFVKPASGAFGGGSSGGAFSGFAGSGTSAFGAGSQQTSAPAFGQSAFGGAGNNAGAGSSTSAFGSTTQNAGAPSAFGATANQPTSAFGSAAKPVSAFGQPSQTASAFGQASKPVSAFGQAAQSAPAFGQTSQPSVFGQPSQPSAFGQASQPSPFGQAAGSQSVFGQQTQPTSAFGSAGTAAGSAFGTGADLPPKPKVGPPDFASALASTKAQPGRDKHDSLLPPDYSERIPTSAKEAFAASLFEWGKIPEWLPPIEFR